MIETALTTAAVAAGVCSSVAWGASTAALLARCLGAGDLRGAFRSGIVAYVQDSQSPARRVGDMDGLLSIALGGAARAASRAVVAHRRSARPLAGLRRLHRYRARRVAFDPRIIVGDRAAVFTAALLLLLGERRLPVACRRC